jgi:hypothetical protein
MSQYTSLVVPLSWIWYTPSLERSTSSSMSRNCRHEDREAEAFVGEPLGAPISAPLGAPDVGTFDGALLGAFDGVLVGAMESAVEGALDGALVGSEDGSEVGSEVGVLFDAALVGASVGQDR